jgi:hypothetical protein
VPLDVCDNNVQFLEIGRENIEQALKVLPPGKSAGSDPIPANIVSACCHELSVPLFILFNTIIRSKCYPNAWKQSRITPIHKKGEKSLVQNYRGVSVVPLFSKVFESFLCQYLLNVTKHLIPEGQHGFMPKRSTVTNLIDFSHYLGNCIDNNSQVDTVYVDFLSAFNKVPHSLLLNKLFNFELNHNFLKLLHSYLSNRSQCVSVNNKSSDFENVTDKT